MVGMPQPVIFDLYNTLIDGADEERDRALREMAALLGVVPADLLRVYRESWKERLVGWGVAETVRIMASRLGVDATAEQVAEAAELRRSLPRRLFDLASAETLAVLDGLRADGHPLGVLSNATAESAEAWPSGPGWPSPTRRSTGSPPSGSAPNRRSACSSATVPTGSCPARRRPA
jgi:putative hydrolase of the HAD superfamily